MKNSSPPPTPPDPTVTAAAQTKSNQDTAQYTTGLNLINQTTPLGSVTYSPIQDATTGTFDESGNWTPNAGSPQRWQGTTSLTPTGQQSFDLQQEVAKSLNNLALQGTGQVSSALKGPANYDNQPSLHGLDTSSLPGVRTIDLSALSPGGKLDLASLGSGPSGINTSNLSQIPKGLDLSSLGAAPKANDATRQAAVDALYGQATSRLDPQWQQQQKDLETTLTNKGIKQGSDAWTNALESFNRSKTDAYDQANFGAIQGGVNYETGQYNLENNAYTTGRDSLQQVFGDALASNNQDFGQRQNEFSAAEQARQQGVNEQEAQYSADQQKRQQDLSEQGAQLTAEQQARATALGEQTASHGVDLSNRQQGITESNYLRELPINEISALMNGGQVSMPQFNNTPTTSVQPTNVAGITENAFQGNLDVWKQQQENNNAMVGAISGLAGSALGGWATGGFK